MCCSVYSADTTKISTTGFILKALNSKQLLKLMWTLFLVFASIFVRLSGSPYLAISFLILLAFILRCKTGIFFISWFFFTLIIIYVGGIIVIFAYLSRLIQLSKINLLNIYTTFFILVRAIVITFMFFLLENCCPQVYWLSSGFVKSNVPLIIFSVLYLLVGLISVYRLCQKTEGPIKRSLSPQTKIC